MAIFNTVPRQSLRWLLAEMVVVILGILIAFQVEEMREDFADRALERSLIENLIDDLDRYLREFDAYANEITTSLDGSQDLMDHLQSDGPRNADLLVQQWADSSRGYLWRSMSPAYDGWRNSNRPDLIADDELRLQLQGFFDSGLSYFGLLSDLYLEALGEYREASSMDFTRRITSSEEDFPYDDFYLLTTPVNDIPSDPEFYPSLDHYNIRAMRVLLILNSARSEAEALRASLVQRLEALN